MTRPRTQKSDWFTQALSALDGVFVSGTPLDPARPWEVVTLRVFGHWPAPVTRVDGLPTHYQLMLALVTVEVERGADVESFEITGKLRGIAHALASLLRVRVDTVIFAGELVDQTRQRGLFPFKLVRDRGTQAVMITAAAYASELNRMRGEDAFPTPPVKLDNRSQNDHIKAWTSASLTPKIAVSDIDAVIRLQGRQRPSRIVLEAKRPTGGRLGTWLPRTNDAVNYRLMQSVSRNNPEIIDVTCAYEAGDAQQGKLSVFTLTTCGRTRLAGKRYEIGANTGQDAVRALLTLLTNLADPAGTVPGTDWVFPPQR